MFCQKLYARLTCMRRPRRRYRPFREGEARTLMNARDDNNMTDLMIWSGGQRVKGKGLLAWWWVLYPVG